MQGRFISLEGLDGTGKTTQCHLIAKWLRSQNIDVIVTREPGDTTLGQKLRTILLNNGDYLTPLTQLMLFSADRCQHVSEVIQPALDKGQWVICDRFTDSTIAYQSFGHDLDLKSVDSVCQIALQGLTPDLTLWLDAPLPMLISRWNEDSIESSGIQFYSDVLDGYQFLSAIYPHRITRINADMDVDEVFWQCQRAIDSQSWF